MDSEGSRTGADSGMETEDSWTGKGSVVDSEGLMLDLTACINVRDISSNLETSLKCLGVTLIASVVPFTTTGSTTVTSVMAESSVVTSTLTGDSGIAIIIIL